MEITILTLEFFKGFYLSWHDRFIIKLLGYKTMYCMLYFHITTKKYTHLKWDDIFLPKRYEIFNSFYDTNYEPNTYSVMCAYAIKAITVADIYVSVLTNDTLYFFFGYI